jgi:hypothetical protein
MEIIKYSGFINELILHPDFNDVKDSEECTIIAFRKYIYIVDDYDVKGIVRIYTDILKELGTYNSESKNIKNEEISDLLRDLQENYPNVVIFRYETSTPDTLMIDVYDEFTQDINSSKFFIDVIKELKNKLGVDTIVMYETVGYSTEETIEKRIFINNLIDAFTKEVQYRKIPKYVYHGTSVKYLSKILKLGLRANLSPSNFKNVKHKNYIFLTGEKTSAIFHAFKAGSVTNMPPIVIQIDTSGLDLSKIDFDYDFFKTYIGDKGDHELYSKIEPNYVSDKNEVLKYLKNKYIGSTYRKFGYNGSIMPKFITKIYYNLTNEFNDFNDSLDNKKEIDEFLEMVDFFQGIDMLSSSEYNFDDYYYQEMKDELEENKEVQEEEPAQIEESKIIKFKTYARKS